MSIHKNKIRVGNFTSSKIVALTIPGSRPMTEDELTEFKKLNPKSQKNTCESTFGEKAFTYIEEKNMERRLGRSLTGEVDARATTWGQLCELYVGDQLGPEYKIIGDVTEQHPTITCWVGSPDNEKSDTMGDIKSPHSLKSFCQLVDPYCEGGKIIHPALTIEAVRNNHTEGDTYYWQIVSNAIIRDKAYGELIVFMPYQRELEDLRRLAQQGNGEDLGKFSWICFANDEQLPYLIEGEHYKNLNVIRFGIPQKDKYFLTNQVQAAEKLLINAEPH